MLPFTRKLMNPGDSQIRILNFPPRCWLKVYPQSPPVILSVFYHTMFYGGFIYVKVVGILCTNNANTN